MNRRNTIILGASTLACAAGADVLHVPGQFSTIQGAVNASANGDEIHVAPGTYSETIELLGKRIALIGTGGADATILDGADLGDSIVLAISGETFDTVIRGFTFTNGEGTLLPGCGDFGARKGGAIYVRFSALTIEDCRFIHNGFDGGLFSGGAITLSRADIAVRRSVFEDNGGFSFDSGLGTAYGGSIAMCDAGIAIIEDNLFVDSHASHGGAILVNFADEFHLLGCTFVGNDASHGGAVNAGWARMTRVADCRFEGNESSHGAGLHVSGSPNVEIRGCEFIENSASFGAGLVLLQFSDELGGPSNALITDCDFERNIAGYGGGVMLNVSLGTREPIPEPVLILENSRFIANEARRDWLNAGMYSSPCRADIGGGLGGAIDARTNHGGELSIVNCLLANNSSERLGGGMLLDTCGGGDLNVTNCTIAHNQREGLRVRLGLDQQYPGPSSVSLRNSVLWGNGDEPLDQVRVGSLADPMLTFEASHSIIEGGMAGAGILNADPRFVDAAAGNYRLGAGSPAIDAADNTRIPAHVVVDLDGNSRFFDDAGAPDTGVGPGPIADMGAYEFAGASCTADLTGSSDPNAPDYGVPDGAADASDFFYYLDQFALGNLAVADLTGSSDPNAANYGVPDGALDASDFFYYLDRFAAGCP